MLCDYRATRGKNTYLGFREVQCDDRIGEVDDCLSGQPNLRRELEDLPRVRLEDGSHMPPHLGGLRHALLSSEVPIGFQVLRLVVCVAKRVLDDPDVLGLTSSEPVDGVIRSVLQMYRRAVVEVRDSDHESYVGHILNVSGRESRRQREMFSEVLRDLALIRITDTSDKSKRISTPAMVYPVTKRLNKLFAGMGGVPFLDYSRLRGDGTRGLFEACGTVRSLRPVPVRCHPSEEQPAELRHQGGLERSTWTNGIGDKPLSALGALVSLMQGLRLAEQQERPIALWQVIRDVEGRRGHQAVAVDHTWHHGTLTHTVHFDAAFALQPPGSKPFPSEDFNRSGSPSVDLDTLGRQPNPILRCKIRFKCAVIEQIATGADFEPERLGLLKRIGVTGEADLLNLLRVNEAHIPPSADHSPKTENPLSKLLSGTPPPTGPVKHPIGVEAAPRDGHRSGRRDIATSATATTRQRAQGPSASQSKRRHSQTRGAEQSAGSRTSGSASVLHSSSYVSAHPEYRAPKSDDHCHGARMPLGGQAIEFILSLEHGWGRCPPENPGFDLYPTQLDEKLLRCAVKATTGNLTDRPISLSPTQFDSTSAHSTANWLSVGKHGSAARGRIVRIHQTAGYFRTITFDRRGPNMAARAFKDEHRED